MCTELQGNWQKLLSRISPQEASAEASIALLLHMIRANERRTVQTSVLGLRLIGSPFLTIRSAPGDRPFLNSGPCRPTMSLTPSKRALLFSSCNRQNSASPKQIHYPYSTATVKQANWVSVAQYHFKTLLDLEAPYEISFGLVLISEISTSL